MKLINKENVLLQEVELKVKLKKGEVAIPNTSIVGEATVVISANPELKKGDVVIINRNGIFPITRGKMKYVLLNIEDILLKI